jgi:N-alpha-acetyltransferase 15/16, NatA auxiliary subunit
VLALDEENAKAHEQAVRLRQALDKEAKTLPPKVAEVIAAEFTEIPAFADLAKHNEEFRQRHKNSAPHVLATIRVQDSLGVDRARLGKEVVGLLQIEGVGLREASDAQELLKSWKSGELEAFKKAAAQKWPEASLFI